MTFGPASPIAELNDAGANDIQPNVRKDGREIVFSSNRAGGAGGQDIWSATRDSVEDPWSAPVNLGIEREHEPRRVATVALVGRGAAPLRARRPGRTREGGTGASDIYVTTRERATERAEAEQRPRRRRVCKPAGAS